MFRHIMNFMKTSNGEVSMRTEKRNTRTSTGRVSQARPILIFTMLIGIFMCQGCSARSRRRRSNLPGNGNSTRRRGALTVPWPAHAVDDVALLFVETANEAVTLSTPAGFAAVTNSRKAPVPGVVPAQRGLRSTGTRHKRRDGKSRCRRFRRSPGRGDPNVPGVYNTGNPWDVTAGSVKAPPQPPQPSRSYHYGRGTLICLPLPQTKTWTNTNAHFSGWTFTGNTERFDQMFNAGRGGGLGIATAPFAGTAAPAHPP